MRRAISRLALSILLLLALPAPPAAAEAKGLPGGRFWGFEGFVGTHPVLATMEIAFGMWVLIKLLKTLSKRRRAARR